MASMHYKCKVVAETKMEALQPTYADHSTQRDLPRTEIVVHTLSCMELVREFLWYNLEVN